MGNTNSSANANAAADQKEPAPVGNEYWLAKLEKQEAILRRNPNDAEAHNNKGNALSGLKRYEEAIVCYNAALKINPNDAYTHNDKGYALSGLKRYEEAIVCYNAALKINPNYVEAHNSKRITLKKLCRYDEAIACYDAILRIIPNDAYTHTDKGYELSGLKRYEEAIVCYNAALKINPNDAYAHNNKGNALSGLKRYEEAIVCYNAALKINPNDAYTHNDKGYALSGLKRYEEAIVCYNAALKINPNNTFIHCNKILAKAQYLGELRFYPEALDGLKVAEEKSSEEYIKQFIVPCRIKILSEWGDQLRIIGHYQEAQEKYKQVLVLDAKHIDSLLGLADTLLITPKKDAPDEKSPSPFSKAREYYGEVLKLNPLSVRAQHNLAVCYRQSAEDQKAITQYETIIKNNPKHLPSYFNLACALVRDPSPKQQSYAETILKEYKTKCLEAKTHGFDADFLYDNVDDLPPTALVLKVKEESTLLKGQQIAHAELLANDKNSEIAKRYAIQLGILTGEPSSLLDRKAVPAASPSADNKHIPVTSIDQEVLQAVRSHDLNKLRLLKLQGKNLNVSDDAGNTLLHLAAECGAGEDLLTYLITECGCGIDKLNRKGETPLYLAVKNQRVAVVDCLMRKGASLTIQYADHLTIVAFALKIHCKPELLNRLLSLSQDINSPAPGGRIPVAHLAAALGNEEALTWLVTDKHANVNALDEKGMSPLAHAVLSGQEPVVRKLLAPPLNANFNSQDPSGTQLLEQLEKSELPSDAKEKIKSHLTNYTATKLREKEQRAKKTNQLAEALFLALFADGMLLTLDEKEAKANKSSLPTTSKLLQLMCHVFTTLPEKDIHSLITRLNLENTELKSSPQGKQLIEYAAYQLFQKRADKKETTLFEIVKKPARDKWHSSLESDSKKQAEFGQQVQGVVQKFIQETKDNIAQANLIHKIISNLELKPKIASYFKTKLTEILMADRRIIPSRLDEKSINELTTNLVKEIRFTLKEDDSIKEAHQEPIYRQRVSIAIWDWLAATNQLPPVEKQFYELAKQIQNQLDQLRDRKKLSDKKPSLERLLILEVLLEQSDLDKDDILQHVKVGPPKDAKEGVALSFVEYVAKNKHGLETAKDKNVKDKSYDGLSRSTANQKGYKNNLKKVVSDWLIENNRQEYSTSRVASLSLSSSSPDNKMSPYEQNKLTPKQELFVTHFCQEFERFYCMYKAIDFGLVRRNEEKVDQLAKIAERYEHVTVNVENVNVPVGMIGSFIMKLMVWRKDRDVQKAAARIGWIFGSRLMEENARYIRFAAEYIAYRHQMQIELLTTPSIQVVGECAADRAIQYITASDENLVVTQPSFLARIWEAFKQSVAYEKYAPMLLPEFKGPVSAVIDGVIEGESEKDKAKSVSTTKGDTWAPGGVFRNVGFITKDEHGQIRLYRHPNLVTISDKNVDQKEHGLLAYGYCWVRPEELELAIKHGWIEDKTPLEQIVKHYPELGQQPKLPVRTATGISSPTASASPPMLPSASPTASGRSSVAASRGMFGSSAAMPSPSSFNPNSANANIANATGNSTPAASNQSLKS